MGEQGTGGFDPRRRLFWRRSISYGVTTGTHLLIQLELEMRGTVTLIQLELGSLSP
jgi:hypothetical protein